MAARWTSVILCLPLAATAFCLAQPARAADDVDQFALSPDQLFDATVVSVSKISEKLMAAPAAIYVLTNQKIMRFGATSVPEALREVPGINVAQINANSWANSWTISACGFNSSLANKLLVLIDGREVYDPLFSGVYWDVQDLVLEGKSLLRQLVAQNPVSKPRPTADLLRINLGLPMAVAMTRLRIGLFGRMALYVADIPTRILHKK